MITTNAFPNFTLNTIDTDIQAYILGWLVGGKLDHNPKSITLTVKEKDIDCLVTIKDQINPFLTVVHDRANQIVSLVITEEKVVNPVFDYFLKEANILQLTKHTNHLTAFVKGYFESSGSILNTGQNHSVKCFLKSSILPAFLPVIDQLLSIPYERTHQQITWKGNNALDMLGQLYDNELAIPSLRSKYNQYLQLCWWTFQPKGSVNHAFTKFQWSKSRPDAVAPFKKRVSDSGYDLTLLEKIKQSGLLEVYETGIKVNPPFGYYFDLVGRSSISKSGYVLANSVGIIDRTYRGTIKVALLKVDPSKPALPLPNRLVQLIPRPIQHFEMVELAQLEETSRNEGGFGSTNTAS